MREVGSYNKYNYNNCDITTIIRCDGLPRWHSGKESACQAGDLGLIAGSGSCLEEENGNHSSILAWRIPWTEEPDRLQSIVLQRAGQDWSNLACTYSINKISWAFSGPVQETHTEISNKYLNWRYCELLKELPNLRPLFLGLPAPRLICGWQSVLNQWVCDAGCSVIH